MHPDYPTPAQLERLAALSIGEYTTVGREDRKALSTVLRRLARLEAEVSRLQGWEPILGAAEVRDRERGERLEMLEAANARLRTALQAATDTLEGCGHVGLPYRDCRALLAALTPDP